MPGFYPVLATDRSLKRRIAGCPLGHARNPMTEEGAACLLAPESALRVERNLLNRIKLMLPVQPSSQKYFRSLLTQITCISLHRPVPQRGGSRSSRTRGGMRWTQAALLTRARACGRRSRVVLTPRRWRQVLEKQASWGRWWQTSPVTKESAKETVKTIAQGRPGVPVDLWRRTRVLSTLCTRGCGCSGHPAFPAPSDFWADGSCTTRALRAAGKRSHMRK